MLHQHDFYMTMAARLALRGHGGAEPNPLVGCVIVSDRDTVVGWGYHGRCGGPHAEIVALRRAGARAAGSTVYVTLEPCNHTGRTGPCAEALIGAAVARTVLAGRDPSPTAGGGAQRLRAAGIAVETFSTCRAATALNDPYLYRVRTGLPWVVCKWAQTIDGRIATRSGESRWLSNTISRRLVHRERGRVDAILTGIGTVIADDPLLTARCVRRRRTARRVVVDPKLAIPLKSKLILTASEAPVTVACEEHLLAEGGPRAAALAAAGVELIGVPTDGRHLSLVTLLGELARRHETATLFVDGGAGLLGRLFEERLVNQTWIVIAPQIFGDEQAIPCVRGLTVTTLTEGVQLKLADVRRRGHDVLLRYDVKDQNPPA